MKFLLSILVLPLFFCTSDVKKSDSLAINKIETLSVADTIEPFALVQLFTSQGCSSCPSADILLDKVKSKYDSKGVAVLSYHVDYWNRLGWKDPFSASEYTTLQNVYASKFKSRNVYTPQVVINGSIHFVGSNEDKMNGYLSKYLKNEAENSVTISKVTKKINSISFSYDVTGNTNSKKLKVVLVIAERITPIKRGENGGKSLKNSNIVVEEITILNSNGTNTITIPSIVNPNDELKLIAYVQNNNLEVTGGTQASIE